MLKTKLVKLLTALVISIPCLSFAQDIYQSNNTYYGGTTYQVAGHTYYGSQRAEYTNSNNNSNIQMNRIQSTYNSSYTNKPQPKPQNATSNYSNGVYYIKGSKPCFIEAARFHNVDPWLLLAIATVESGLNPNAINRNTNGSYDVGLMQINSIWLPILKKKGISPAALKDACASTYIGAWILSDNIKRYGYTWRAIGAYNSANPRVGLIYAKKVYAAHARILANLKN